MLYPIRYILIVFFVFITTAATVWAQTNSITLAWDPNDSAEQVTEYTLYYKTGTSGPPYNGVDLDQGDSPITIRVNDLADENNPEFGLTGLNPGVTYRFVITAFNGTESDYSDEVSYASQAPADLDHVEIEGPQTIPENSTVQFTLQAYFNNNTNNQVNATSWEVNCADASISSDGVLTTRDVTVNTQCTVSATYTSGITRSDQIDITIEDTTTVTLDHIEIDGPGSVDENSSATYNCIAHYTDGSNEMVAAESWSEDCPGTSISINGVLTTGEVGNNTQCTISAMYLSQSHEMGINIRNNTTAATLDRVIIEGPNSVDEGSSITFTCRAYYSDGSNQIVTPDDWAITTGATLADITNQGVLNAHGVDTDGTVGIIASHTDGQSTRSDEIQVTIKDTDTISPTPPGEITLAWDPNDPVEQVTEYRLYYKTGTSGPPYNGIGLDQGHSPIIIPVANLADENNPEFGLSGFNTAVTYRFRVTAFNDTESDFSDEVLFTYQTSGGDPTLDRIVLEGPQIIDENSTGQYTLRAYLTDGTSSLVGADSANIDCPAANLSSNGLVRTGEVSADTQCTISASYSYEGISRSTHFVLTIRDNNAVAVLDHIEIEGPQIIDENSTGQYTLRAYLTDGTSSLVGADSNNIDCPPANLSRSGFVRTGEVSADTQCTISASYSYEGISRSTHFVLTIRDR